MLVKVRLPTPLLPHHLPQLPQIPQIPAHMRVSMTDVDLTLSALPSSTTILASILALFVLLSFVRALTIGFQEHLAFVRGRKAALAVVGKGPSGVSASSVSAAAGGVGTSEKTKQEEVAVQRPTASWLWGLVQFFPPRLSATPAPAEKQQSWPRGPSQPQMHQIQQPKVNAHTASRRPGGPEYDRPLATLYERDVPVSMAKMIMSRHTFRRPTSRPPPARPASVQIQIQRRGPPSPPPPASSSHSHPGTQVIPPPPSPSTSSFSSSSTSTSSSAPSPSSAVSPPHSHSIPTQLTQANSVSRPSIVIPAPKSPLYRPISPPSRSPSPPSASSASSSSRSTSPVSPSSSPSSSPVSPPSSSRGSTGSRSPSPTSPERSPSGRRSPTMEELVEMQRMHGHGRSGERRESEIV